jgi:hypothetical protein
MTRGSLAVLAALMLAACAENAPPSGASAAAAIATPFYVAAKVPVCAGTVAVAGPLGALAALAPGDDALYVQGEIARGLTLNCGPPYVLAR